MQKNSCLIPSPIGLLYMEADEFGICKLELCSGCGHGADFVEEKDMCVLLRQARMELEEYFAGKRQYFEVPVSLAGTEFQRKVWESLKKIPYGKTRSYGEIASDIGNPKAARAVGMANNRNPVMILVPCHRVIGKDGSLVGYGGGLEVKRFLLNLENRGTTAC